MSYKTLILAILFLNISMVYLLSHMKRAMHKIQQKGGFLYVL